jgi:Flp pilus assembly protein TadD
VAERPRDAQAHNILGTILLKLDDVDGAVEEFRRAVQLEPRLTEAQVNLAQALMKTGHVQEARITLAKRRA